MAVFGMGTGETMTVTSKTIYKTHKHYYKFVTLTMSYKEGNAYWQSVAIDDWQTDCLSDCRY